MAYSSLRRSGPDPEDSPESLGSCATVALASECSFDAGAGICGNDSVELFEHVVVGVIVCGGSPGTGRSKRAAVIANIDDAAVAENVWSDRWGKAARFREKEIVEVRNTMSEMGEETGNGDRLIA